MPAPTALPAASRFFQPEIAKYVFVPTIASATLVPTGAELGAGDDITGDIADISGWMVQSNQIDTPDMGTRFVGQIGGRTSAPSSSITFYGSQDAIDARVAMPRDTEGFLVIADGGLGTGSKADVFPVKVSSVGKVRSTGDQAFQVTITYSITAEPAEDVAVPSLA